MIQKLINHWNWKPKPRSCRILGLWIWISGAILGHFPFVRTGRPDHCRTSHFNCEIGFFRGFLPKNYLLPAHCLGFDWSGWIVLINSEILITTGMVWPVSSDKWEAPLVSLNPKLHSVKTWEEYRGRGEVRRRGVAKIKWTVFQRCKSLLCSWFTGFKVFYLILSYPMYRKHKTSMLLHRHPKPRRLVGSVESPCISP